MSEELVSAKFINVHLSAYHYLLNNCKILFLSWSWGADVDQKENTRYDLRYLVNFNMRTQLRGKQAATDILMKKC